MKSGCLKKRGEVWLFILFFISLFAQCVIFNDNIFHRYPHIPNLWLGAANSFFAFYLPKAAISLVLASLVFLFRRKGWIVVASFLLDIVMLALIVYYRCNNVMMDAWCLTMAGNMKGFWSGILPYVEWCDMKLFGVSALLLVCYLLFRNRERNVRAMAAIMGVAYLLSIVGTVCICEWRGRDALPKDAKVKFCLNPFDGRGYHDYYYWVPDLYCNDFSYLHYSLYQFGYLKEIISDRNLVLDENEQEQVRLLTHEASVGKPATPLIICLIESLETWAITEESMPNLYNFVQNHESILYAESLCPQRMYGSSADGQMIVLTGLLPLQKGAACFRYPGNTYPSVNALYAQERTAALIPHDLGVWNQSLMNRAYGYDTSYVCPSNDRDIFTLLPQLIHKYSSVMTFTMSTHTPFTAFADSSDMVTPEDMPVFMADYLKSFHFTDACMAGFLSAIDTDSVLRNTTIVITSDHSIFSSEKIDQFREYVAQHQLPYNMDKTLCPCIIYSPSLQGRQVIEEEACQMDVYPTMLDVLGVEPYWKGVGVSLLCPDFNNARAISESEAFSLSDHLIRSNYFSKTPVGQFQAE